MNLLEESSLSLSQATARGRIRLCLRRPPPVTGAALSSLTSWATGRCLPLSPLLHTHTRPTHARTHTHIYTHPCSHMRTRECSPDSGRQIWVGLHIFLVDGVQGQWAWRMERKWTDAGVRLNVNPGCHHPLAVWLWGSHRSSPSFCFLSRREL